MKNIQNIYQKWEQEQKERQASAVEEATPLLKQLKQQGVCEITIYYSGSGDSGCIDRIELDVTPLQLSPEETLIIEELAFESLPAGWEINDGSEGNITLDLDEEYLDLNHYWLSPTYDENLSGFSFSLED